MTKDITKDKAPKRISDSEHELRMVMIMGGPEPMPVRTVKAMTNRLLRLQQEIIELADPEMCRTLLPWIASCLDDLIESASRQSSASHSFAAILEAFARKKETIGP
jgi:hypothetical protein